MGFNSGFQGFKGNIMVVFYIGFIHTGKVKKETEVCEWVLKVWDNISRDRTVCGFKM
jgi:hypothetical protein